MTVEDGRDSFFPRRRTEIVEDGECAVPPTFEALEQTAMDHLDPHVYDHVAGGAGTEDTKRANREAFRRFRIVPRVLRDVTERDLSIRLFGRKLPTPVLLAPIGTQTLYHEEGELASAAAAAALGVPFTLGTAASKSMEKVANVMDDAPRLFQLYWPSDWDITASLVERAEASGYDAIVLTVDSPLPKWRVRNLTNRYDGWKSIPKANLESDPVAADRVESSEDGPGPTERLGKDTSITWEDLTFLREHTSLPIVLKGIVHPDDAKLAVRHDVDGVVVSNHGGRQIDGSIASLEALPAVVDAVDGEIPVLFDSGVRNGADAFKAIALGASAVFLGRPYIYGLAVAGERGVSDVVQNVAAELESIVALSGHTSIDEVDRSLLVDSTRGSPVTDRSRGTSRRGDRPTRTPARSDSPPEDT